MEIKLENIVHPIPGPIKTLTVGDQVFQSVNDWKLSERETELVKNRLGETEEKKKKCLQEIKKKLSNDGVRYRMDDDYLLRFLRFKKYDCEKTYQNIKKFYRVRQQKPDFYSILPDLQSVLDTHFFDYLPYTDEEGRVILWFTAGRWNLKERSVEEIISSATAVYDIVVSNPKVQINGIIVIFDMEGFTFRHMLEFAKKNRFLSYFNLVENNMPWRLIKFFIVNTNQVTRKAWSIVRPLIRSKLADRFILLGSDFSELHEFVNPVLLPKALGGTLDEEDCSITQQVMNNLDYLKYERFMCFGGDSYA